MLTILEGWSAVEADFQRYYMLNPLTIFWRRFRVLLRHLPSDGAFGHFVQEEQEYRSGGWWKKMLGKATGRQIDNAERMTLDQLMQSQRGE